MKKALMKASIILFAVCALRAISVSAVSLTSDGDQEVLSFVVHVRPGEELYQESIAFKSDVPTLKVVSWTAHSTKKLQHRYDAHQQETKAVYGAGDLSFVVRLDALDRNVLQNSTLHLFYRSAYAGKDRGFEDLLIPIKQVDAVAGNEALPLIQGAAVVTQQSASKTGGAVPVTEIPQKRKKPFSLSKYVGKLVKRHNSTSVRLLLVFLLGLLLSLTPCIYPMIPITIGVLQGQSSTSILRNFFGALAYASGLATTFALFGVLASCVGPLCGQLLSNPMFVLVLVLILGYFALSMLGLYEIRMPQLSSFGGSSGSGSFIAAFIFGAASGTFASPCVSPGLALLLSVVATMGSKMMGFLLLFLFGMGLSVPLIVVGTLSSSVSLLPRAGVWMVEVKKFFGLLMIGVCFYYLSYAFPLHAVLIAAACGLWFCAAVYVRGTRDLVGSVWYKISYIIAFLLLVTSFVVLFYAVRGIITRNSITECPAQASVWAVDYELAREKAATQGKHLFVDFWARYCSICLSINKKLLPQPEIVKALEQFVPVKVDASQLEDPQFACLKERFNVVGVPLFLVVDPKTQTVVKRWGAEIYSLNPDEFAQDLLRFATGDGKTK